MNQKLMSEIAENMVKSGTKLASEGIEGAGKSVVKNIVNEAATETTKNIGKTAEKSVSGIVDDIVETAISKTDMRDALKNMDSIPNSERINKSLMSSFQEEALYEDKLRSMSMRQNGVEQKIHKQNANNAKVEKIRSSRNSESQKVKETISTTSKPRSLEEYAQRRYTKQFEGLTNENAQTLEALNSNNQSIDKLYKKYNIEPGNKEELSSKINDHFNNSYSNLKEGPTAMDWMGYNQVPEKATAVGGTAWLVSKMSSAKGRQSNADLYGGEDTYR